MIVLLPIGFGLMVLALRLRMVRRALNRGQAQSEGALRQLLQEGRVLLIGGLAILALAVIWEFTVVQFQGFSVLLGTGASVAYLGLPGLLQWAVSKERGTERRIQIWERVLSWGGGLCLIAYVINTVVIGLIH